MNSVETVRNDLLISKHHKRYKVSKENIPQREIVGKDLPLILFSSYVILLQDPSLPCLMIQKSLSFISCCQINEKIGSVIMVWYYHIRFTPEMGTVRIFRKINRTEIEKCQTEPNRTDTKQKDVFYIKRNLLTKC